MSIKDLYQDIQDRVNVYCQVNIPDWLDTNPPKEEMQQMIAYHLWIVAAAQDAIRSIERKLEGS